MNDESSARACRYCSDRRLRQRCAWVDSPFCCSFPSPWRVAKTSLQISVCTAMRVEGRHADGAAGAHALPGHIEQLPVQVEALFRTHEIARQHPLAPAASFPRTTDPSAAWARAAASANSKAAPPATTCAPAARQWRPPARSRTVGIRPSVRSSGRAARESCSASAANRPTRESALPAWKEIPLPVSRAQPQALVYWLPFRRAECRFRTASSS